MPVRRPTSGNRSDPFLVTGVGLAAAARLFARFLHRSRLLEEPGALQLLFRHPVRSDGYGLLQVGDGLVIALELEQERAVVAVGLGALRIELDALAIVAVHFRHVPPDSRYFYAHFVGNSF